MPDKFRRIAPAGLRPARPSRLGVIGSILLASLFWCQSASGREPCEADAFGGNTYVVCDVSPRDGDLRLFWKDRDGKPYRFFSNVAAAAGEQGRKLVFAMNAGMYHPDFTPLGLYVEDGSELHGVNARRKEGDGRPIPNFYKMPNGIFYVDRAGARIVTTAKFLKRRPDAVFATQSGPMLVIDGKLHPALVAGSGDRNRRSGVGVCQDGHVRFAISDDRVNFHDFALLFRDHLACPNALFLDGGRGAGIYAPALGRNDISWHGGYGPMFGLVE